VRVQVSRLAWPPRAEKFHETTLGPETIFAESHVSRTFENSKRMPYNISHSYDESSECYEK